MKKDLCSYFSNMVSASDKGVRYTSLVALAIVLSGCLSVPGQPEQAEAPQVSACQLLAADSQLRTGLVRAQQRWALKPGTALAVLEVEPDTGFNLQPYGLSWDEYRIATENWQARTDQLDYALDFIGWNLQRSQRRYGLDSDNTAGLYLAYRLGSTDPRRLQGTPQLQAKAAAVADQAKRYSQQLEKCTEQMTDTGWGRQWLKWMN